LYIPYSSTEAVVEDNKDTYYRALRQTQTSFKTQVDYEPWLMFFLKTLQKQKIRLEYKLDMMTTKTNSNIDLPIISAKIMEVFAIKERATISEISELTAVNQNTIKKHLAKLVENNYLIKHGKTRGAWYTKK
jgi:Fic family protein